MDIARMRLLAEAGGQYRYLDVSRGDYSKEVYRRKKPGEAAGQMDMYKAMLNQAKKAANDREKDHFRYQVSDALGAGAVSPQQGERLYLAAGLTRDGGFAR